MTMFRLFLSALLMLVAIPAQAQIAFWNVPRHSANSFNKEPPSQAYFDALAAYGATWVRLAYDKWKPAQRDFLIGNADHYDGLVPADLATLKTEIGRAHKAGLKVVIVPLSLPGQRWIQDNDGVYDGRLWRDKTYWAESAAFWRDLASALKGTAGIAAYNILNEPTPEKGAGLPEHSDAATMRAWYAAHKGGPHDLIAFYRTVIAAIRSVDRDTPIMLDAGWYAAADAFAYWPGPLDDPNLLYSFHMYEPYAATSGPNLRRAHPYAYPGVVPFAGHDERWDAKRVAAYLAQPIAWADAHGVPRNRMVAAEFGCVRRMPFCPRYLEDVLTVLDADHVHWAFYAFREDEWDAMDYELGGAKVPGRYWDDPWSVKRGPTPQFAPILKRLRADKRPSRPLPEPRASLKR